jgi:hypothetical protein
MFYEPKFHGLFILCSLFLHCCCCSYWDFELLFVNIEFRERQKADFEPSSHFVKILLVVCQNCLNQFDKNKQSLIRAHCSIVTVALTIWGGLTRFCSSQIDAKGVEFVGTMKNDSDLIAARKFCENYGKQSKCKQYNKWWLHVVFDGKIQFVHMGMGWQVQITKA